MNGSEFYSLKDMIERQSLEHRRDLEELSRRIEQRFEQNDKQVARELVVLGDKVPTRTQFEAVVFRVAELENFKSNTQGRDAGTEKQMTKVAAKVGAVITIASILLQILFRIFLKGEV